ncbi:hypothetical protein ACLOJK_035275 [Asimina triloba]
MVVLNPIPVEEVFQALGFVSLYGLERAGSVVRPAAGTAAGGATVAGRRHRDGARPATGSHNPQAVGLSYIKSYRKFGSTSPPKHE